MLKSVIHQLLTPDYFQLEVIQIGNGNKAILAFHGFGRTGEDWEQVYNGWGIEYTIYSLNLYFHGNCKFPKGRNSNEAVTKSEFESHLLFVLKYFQLEKVNVAGYSLGGKLALTFAEIFPEKVLSLWLFAPDGIKTNPWYYLATNTCIGRRMYSSLLENPIWIFSIINFAKSLRIIDSKIEKLAFENLNSNKKRKLAKDVWLSLRLLNPDRIKLKNHLNIHKIQLIQIYGLYDSIIPSKPGKRFARSIRQEENVFIIKCGHWLFREATIRQMNQLQTRKGC